MSNSSLVKMFIPAYHYTKGREGKHIKMVTIHHMAGILTAEQCGRIFQSPTRKASSHYGIGIYGEIGQYVYEENTAWANGNWDSNCKSVTIEVSDDNVTNWHVSDLCIQELIKLIADIFKRNNLGKAVAR